MVNEETGKVEESENTGEGDKPKTVDVLKQQSKRIEELENAAEERAMEDAKKQMGGNAEAGKQEVKKETETDHEYRVRIDKELAEGKTEFGT